MILAVVENDARESMINAVVDVVAGFPVPHGLADDARDGHGGSGDEKAARLGENLNVLREQPADLGIDLFRQPTERLHVFVVVRRETAADVEDLDFVPARLRFAHHRGGHVERLHEILEVRALAADVEAQAFHDQPCAERGFNQVHCFAGIAAEFRGQLDHRAGIGHAQTQHDAGVGGELLDFSQLVYVVIRDERFVLVECLKRFFWLGGIGVDDFVPDEILLLFGREMPDVIVNEHKLWQRRDVETRSSLVKRAHDFRRRIGFYRVVALHLGQMLLELSIVAADHVVVDHHHRRAVFPGEGLKLLLRHGACDSLPGFKCFRRSAQAKTHSAKTFPGRNDTVRFREHSCPVVPSGASADPGGAQVQQASQLPTFFVKEIARHCDYISGSLAAMSER